MELSEARGKLIAIDAGSMNCTSLPDAEEEKNLSRCGLRLHVLTEEPKRVKKRAGKAAPGQIKGKK